nr:hypothetical protein [uncultured Actinoplanes sp.]
MRRLHLAPLTLIASFGIAFSAACGDEKTIGDAAAAAATHHQPNPDLPEKPAGGVWMWRGSPAR